MVLLVHGFGASISHFRYNIPQLVEEQHAHTVYAIDLLGLGGSEKPPLPAGIVLLLLNVGFSSTC